MTQEQPFRRKEWYRRREGKAIAGVAAGLSETFGLPLAFVRILFILSLLLGGGGLVLYVACWIVMPIADPLPPKALPREPDEIIHPS